MFQIRNSRHSVHQLRQICRSTGGFELAFSPQLVAKRDEVNGLLRLAQLNHVIEDAAMRVEKEILRLELLNGRVEHVVLDQNGAEDAALGFEVLRQRPFQSCISRRTREFEIGSRSHDLYSPYLRLEAAWNASTSIPRERRIEDVRVKWGTDSADTEDGSQRPSVVNLFQMLKKCEPICVEEFTWKTCECGAEKSGAAQSGNVLRNSQINAQTSMPSTPRGLTLARNADLERGRDAVRQFGGDFVFADDFDRLRKLDAALIDLKALRLQRLRNVAGRHGTE